MKGWPTSSIVQQAPRGEVDPRKAKEQLERDRERYGQESLLLPDVPLCTLRNLSIVANQLGWTGEIEEFAVLLLTHAVDTISGADAIVWLQDSAAADRLIRESGEDGVEQ